LPRRDGYLPRLSRHHRDAQPFETITGIPRQRLGERGEDLRTGLDQQHARRPGIDPTKVAGEGVAGKLGDRTGHLHSGRSAIDHDGGHQGLALIRIGGHLRLFERHQQAGAGLGLESIGLAE
jgi:hypothetical protein